MCMVKSQSESQNFLRPTIIAGNWKMYKTIEEAKSFVETLAPRIKRSQAAIYLAVPFTALYPTAQRAKELKSSLKIGAQNMNDAMEGAFTGEIAAAMLKDAGGEFVILGHSERRRVFHEDNAFIHRKVRRALDVGIQPLLCVGENLEEREGERVEAVLREQLENCLAGLSAEELSKMIFAYEPVWAIGTGKIGNPEEMQAAHAFCRKVLGEIGGSGVAEKAQILYGGSVKPENAADMMVQEDIDGLLVGGASLSSELFSQIISNANKARSKILKKVTVE
jgi:triosephosphate isomerase